jgi:hypothetical protein
MTLIASTLRNFHGSHHGDTNLSTSLTTYHEISPIHPDPRASCHRDNSLNFYNLIRPKIPRRFPFENSSKELDRSGQLRKHARFFAFLRIPWLWTGFPNPS